MLYWRSMTLAERDVYVAAVREWFPQIEITFFLNSDFPGVEPGTPDTHDNTLWRIYRNGVLLEGYIYTYCNVEFEGPGGVFNAVGPDVYRDQVRNVILGDARVFAPFVTEPVPETVAPPASPS